jgi:hypothetical protein
MTSIQPELWVEQAGRALAFYAEAFGARVLHRASPWAPGPGLTSGREAAHPAAAAQGRAGSPRGRVAGQGGSRAGPRTRR